MRIVIVCGGRTYNNQYYLNGYLDGFHNRDPIGLLIEGGQSGADSLARTWAILRGVPWKTVEAEWTKYGNAAGPIRNALMASDYEAEQLLAFPGGDGTANMIKVAHAAGLSIEDLRKLG